MTQDNQLNPEIRNALTRDKLRLLKKENKQLLDLLELAWFELSRWPNRYPEDSTIEATQEVIISIEKVIDVSEKRKTNEKNEECFLRSLS